MNSSLKNLLFVGIVVLLFFAVFNNYILARPLGDNNRSNSFFQGGSCCAPGVTSESRQQQGPANDSSNNFSSRGSCCGVESSSTDVTGELLQRQGLAYYATSTGDTAGEAVVEDYGCHQEIFIYKDGELVMRLAYAGGNLFEI